LKKTYFPSNSTLEEAVLQALENLGGEADVPAINEELIRILDLPEEIVTLEDESGLGTKLDYRLRWCRTNLKAKHQIKNIKRGTWALDNAK
jgi:restriction endonuclease, similarity to mrr